MLNCLFCYWNRIQDVAKGSPLMDMEKALAELKLHVQDFHIVLWMQLLMAWDDDDDDVT